MRAPPVGCPWSVESAHRGDFINPVLSLAIRKVKGKLRIVIGSERFNNYNYNCSLCHGDILVIWLTTSSLFLLEIVRKTITIIDQGCRVLHLDRLNAGYGLFWCMKTLGLVCFHQITTSSALIVARFVRTRVVHQKCPSNIYSWLWLRWYELLQRWQLQRGSSIQVTQSRTV